MSLASHLPAALQHAKLDAPLSLRLGGQLPMSMAGYQTWGRLNEARDNVIWVCHALTGSSDVASWWSGLFGPGRTLDPERYYIVCANVLGGCYGSSGPLSIDPLSGQRYGADFPELSIADLVAQQRQLADHLDIRGIQLVIGASMGGFQALEWARQEPRRVQRLALVATSWRQPPQALAQARLQCEFIRRDPKFLDGRYLPEQGPAEGLALARQLGHLSYRSAAELEQRFARSQREDGHYQVLSYLDHQGHKLVRRFDALSYLRLTEAMNRFDLAEGGDPALVLATIQQPAVVVSLNSDQLYYPAEQRRLARYLPAARLIEIQTLYGHDGFLVDAHKLDPQLLAFRDQGAPSLAAVPSAPVLVRHVPQRQSGHFVRERGSLRGALRRDLGARRRNGKAHCDDEQRRDRRKEQARAALTKKCSADRLSKAESRRIPGQREQERAFLRDLTKCQGQARVPLVLIGATGRVGRELLALLARPEADLPLKLVGVANSRAALWQADGLTPGLAAERLRAQSSGDALGLIEQLIAGGRPALVVDCTASPDIAAEQARLLEHGISVVTANKVAFAASHERYARLAAALARGVPAGWSATVGAGLPVLSTLRRLRAAGDELLEVEASLSGTLGYLLTRTQDGASLRQALTEAVGLGLAEPDPRIDLCGEDVRRKLAIVLRTAGIEVEPERLPLEPLLALSPDGHWLDAVAGHERNWLQLMLDARRAGQRWVYRARWQRHGEVEIGPALVPAEHPLAGARAAENRVVLRTRYHQDPPLVIAGAGAGVRITAAAVYSDLLELLRQWDESRGLSERRTVAVAA